MADIIRWDSDGYRVGLTPLDRIANYAETLADLPTPEEIDEAAGHVTERMIRRAVDIGRDRARGVNE